MDHFVKAESFLWGSKDIHAVLIEGGLVCVFNNIGDNMNPTWMYEWVYTFYERVVKP